MSAIFSSLFPRRFETASCLDHAVLAFVAVCGLQDQQFLRLPIEVGGLEHFHHTFGEDAAQLGCVAEDFEDIEQHLEASFGGIIKG